MENDLMVILQLAITVVLNSGLPVFLANLAKNFPFMKWMDGKTDKVVAWLTVGLFVYAWAYGDFYQTDYLIKILPMYGETVRQILEYVGAGIALFASLRLNSPINGITHLKNDKVVPLIGTRFSEAKK